jgi:hypothetical protein
VFVGVIALEPVGMPLVLAVRRKVLRNSKDRAAVAVAASNILKTKGCGPLSIASTPRNAARISVDHLESWVDPIKVSRLAHCR